MAMGECSVYSSLQARLKGKVCSLAYELAATWLWPTLSRWTKVNFRIRLAPYRQHCKYHPWYYYYYYY